MTETTALAAPPPTLAERLARAYIECRFRLPVAAATVGIPLERAAAMLARDPDVGAHLERLSATGMPALAIVGPRETQELVASILRRTQRDYEEDCKRTGEDVNTVAFSRLRLEAARLNYEMLLGASKRRKEAGKGTRGKAAAIHVTATIVDSAAPPEGPAS